MEKISSINAFNDSSRTVLTLGMFDGVHKGHKAIIEKLNQIAREKGAKSGLLTFSPHPRFVLQKDTDLKLLTLEDEKEVILNRLGLDYMLVQPFDFKFSRTSSLEFVRDYLVNKLNVDVLLIGHDHHFGRNREGTYPQLCELADLYDFQVQQIEAILNVDKPISSTKIRNALLEGDLIYANEALGYNYFLSGKVVHGDGIGRQLGFPTINLEVHHRKLIPMDGVYGVKATVNNDSYNGLLSIGDRPTFDGKDKRVEVYLYDFEGDLYAENVQIEFLTFIRLQKKFESQNSLIEAMETDRDYYVKWLLNDN